MTQPASRRLATEAALAAKQDVATLGATVASDATVRAASVAAAVASPLLKRAPADLTTLGVNAIEAKYGSGFLFKGVNLGFGPSTQGVGRGDSLWVLDFDWAWITDAIDKIAAIGANTVRIIGGKWAYEYNGQQAQFKQRVHQTWDYAISKGLRVIWCFCDGSDLGSWNQAEIDAYIQDLIVGYETNPMMIWDPGNDLYPHSDYAIATAQTIRATGTTCLLTSTNGTNLPQWTYDLDPYVDFHDFHFYFDQSRSTPASYFDVHVAATKKPIVVGETGSDLSTAGNKPWVGDTWQQAEYLRRMLTYIGHGAICGLLVWKIRDTPATNHQFGLYDAAGNPRPQIREFLKIPTQRADVIQATLARRTTPIVYDNFRRADSATSPGTSPIGGAPSANGHTWGIQGKRLYRVSGTGTWATLTWETNSCDVDAELEFTIGSGISNIIGIVFRYVDENNYYLWRWTLSTGSLRLLKVVAGVQTNISPPDRWNRSTTTGADVTGIQVQNYARLGVKLDGSQIVTSLNDRMWMTTDSTSALATATKHGVIEANTDAATRIDKFSVSAPLRYW